jgi:hypothetical protein
MSAERLTFLAKYSALPLHCLLSHKGSSLRTVDVQRMFPTSPPRGTGSRAGASLGWPESSAPRSGPARAGAPGTRLASPAHSSITLSASVNAMNELGAV